VSRRQRILLIAGIVAILGALLAVNLVKNREPQHEVEIEKVRRRNLRSVVSGSGWIDPRRKVEVSSVTVGKVVELAVEEGDTVRAGQLLLRIDPAPYESQVDRLRAAIAAARAERQGAEATLTEAKAQRERTEALAARDLASTTELDAARRADERAVAGLAAARGRLAEAEAMLRSAQYDLSQVTITAAMTGVITRLNIEEGETVVTGTMNNPGTVLLTIADLSSMEARIEVDETDVVNLALGQEAEVTVDAFPDSVLHGVVTEVGSSAQRGQSGLGETSADFDVVVRLSDTLPGLRPGLSATADIVTARRDSTLSVSIGALLYRDPAFEARLAENRGRGRGRTAASEAEEDTLDQGGKRVRRETYGLFLVEKGRARFAPVAIGITGERHFELLGGVADGAQVVSGPFKELRELHAGDRVKRAKGGQKEKTD
jgi:HlyD family secretion protein